MTSETYPEKSEPILNEVRRMRKDVIPIQEKETLWEVRQLTMIDHQMKMEALMMSGLLLEFLKGIRQSSVLISWTKA